MSTHHLRRTTSTPSDWRLRDLPARAATFLRALGESTGAGAAMQSGGYTTKDHQEGLRLLGAACGHFREVQNPAGDQRVRAAEAELTQWVRTDLSRVRAALHRLHPKHASLVAEVDTRDAAHVVYFVSRFLDALDALPASEESQAVLHTLGQRGVNTETRARLARLVADAQTLQTPDITAINKEEEDETLLALLRWYEDWATTARSIIKRRDWLERLGLRRRNRSRNDAEEELVDAQVCSHAGERR